MEYTYRKVEYCDDADFLLVLFARENTTFQFPAILAKSEKHNHTVVEAFDDVFCKTHGTLFVLLRAGLEPHRLTSRTTALSGARLAPVNSSR